MNMSGIFSERECLPYLVVAEYQLVLHNLLVVEGKDGHIHRAGVEVHHIAVVLRTVVVHHIVAAVVRHIVADLHTAVVLHIVVVLLRIVIADHSRGSGPDSPTY